MNLEYQFILSIIEYKLGYVFTFECRSQFEVAFSVLSETALIG